MIFQELQLNIPKFAVSLFFLVTLFRVRSFHLQLTLRQLIQPDMKSRFIVRSHLGPSIYSGSSPGYGLQVVTQSTHLSKEFYPPTGIEPTPCRNSASKVARLQVYASTPGQLLLALILPDVVWCWWHIIKKIVHAFFFV